MQRLYEEQLEAEKQRVEHIAQVGLRRMFQGKLAKGWTAWLDMYLEKVHQQRLLAQSAGRLAKPKLSAALTHWRKDWEAEEKERKAARQKQKLMAASGDREALAVELDMVKKELAAARKAMLEGRGQEAEMQRQMQEQLEAEKQKPRRAHRAGRPPPHSPGRPRQGLDGWHDMWEAKVRQLRCSRRRRGRLSKPKLVAAISHWRKDWESEQQQKRTMSQEQKLYAATTGLEQAEAELHKLRIESKRAVEAGDPERDELAKRLSALDGGAAVARARAAAQARGREGEAHRSQRAGRPPPADAGRPARAGRRGTTCGRRRRASSACSRRRRAASPSQSLRRRQVTH